MKRLIAFLISKPTSPRWFFYAGFEPQTHGKTYFQGFYRHDKLNPADGFEKVVTEIAKHYGYDPAKVHVSAFSPVNL